MEQHPVAELDNSQKSASVRAYTERLAEVKSTCQVWGFDLCLAEFFSFAAIKNGNSLCLGQKVTSSSKCHATGRNCVSTGD